MIPPMNTPAPTPTRSFTVRGPDGDLAVTTWGAPHLPVIVFVHGYPDNQTKWNDVARHLCKGYHVVTYDVRGCGRSFTPPATRASYKLERLCADFTAVINAVSPNRAVHMVAHDWGSIQAWEFATEPALKGRIASYTSVSGPCLDHVGHWMRDRLKRPTPGNLFQFVKQLFKSWYIYFFHLPWVPEALWRGVVGRNWHVILRLLENTHAKPREAQARDGANGVWLYRANMLPRLFGPRARHAQAPVQVLVPVQDNYVNPSLSENLTPWVPRLWRREVQAGHWLTLKHPEMFASLVREFIEHIDGAPESPALRKARVQPDGEVRATRAQPFVNQVAVITGAGSGIGRCAADSFGRRGATIVAVDINLEAAERTAQSLRDRGIAAHARQVDVGQGDEMQALASWVDEALGGADIVVNNAGIGMGGGVLSTTERDWQRVIDVNLWGVIHGCRLFAQQMAAKGRKGHILNTASAAAYGPSRSLPAYATTKAAVLMLSECLRGELAERGIGVTAICPGFAETGIMASTEYVGVSTEAQAEMRRKAARLYAMRGLQPETVAEAMVRAVQRNQAVVSVGAEAHGSRWLYRLMPWVSRRIARIDLLPH